MYILSSNKALKKSSDFVLIGPEDTAGNQCKVAVQKGCHSHHQYHHNFVREIIGNVLFRCVLGWRS